jgi:hypothetical protein
MQPLLTPPLDQPASLGLWPFALSHVVQHQLRHRLCGHKSSFHHGLFKVALSRENEGSEEGEYGWCTLYTSRKMEHWNLLKSP